MKLGIAIDWAGKRIQLPLERIQLAESLGFDSVWAAEAYGSDALTPLAFLAAKTNHIKLGTGIAQVSARTPTAMAMALATLDQLAGDGRVICGLGLSGPQVVEGWYGQSWDKPYWRMKDYVQIIKTILKREAPAVHQGRAISLPYQGEDSCGLGKPLKSILHPNPDIPVWLGTGSQAMVTLTAEIADGWLPFGFAPGSMPIYQQWLEDGFQRSYQKTGLKKGFDDFHIQAACQVCLTDDVEAELNRQKFAVALYVGGMGHEQKNFHKDMMIRRGYADAAERIQGLFLAGKREEAVAAVPDEYVDDGALIGPVERIKTRLDAWASSGAKGLTLHGADDTSLRLIADHFYDKG
jgi:F420-dependent oxidoreductase-like protein